MKKIRLTPVFIFFLLLETITITGQPSGEWHYPLYLSNMGYWHSRIPLEITNPSAHDAEGEQLKLKIGISGGQLNLGEREAGAIRVVDSKGIELLWKIISPDHRTVTDGPVPAGSEFVLPASVKAGQSTVCYIYFNNRAAWPTGAVLDGPPSAGKRKLPVKTPVAVQLRVKVKPVESMDLKKEEGKEVWPEDTLWKIKVPVRVYNFTEKALEGLPVYVNMWQVFQRMKYKGCGDVTMITGEGSDLPHFRSGDALIFESRVPSLTGHTVYACFGAKEGSGNDSGLTDYSGLYADKRNLVRNPGPDRGEDFWVRLDSGEMKKISAQGVTGDNDNGGYCFRINGAPEGKSGETGWKQDIPVKTGRKYMFGALVRSQDVTGGLKVSMTFITAQGEKINKPVECQATGAATHWSFISGICKAPENGVSGRITIALNSSGTAWFKGVTVLEVIEGYASSMFLDQRDAASLSKLTVWPVNSLVKVFQEDLPPDKIPEAAVSAARNETEPLQIAIRSPRRCKKLRVEVDPPVNNSGQKLNDISTFLEGYVPVDYPSNYYEKKVPYWYLKYPDEPAGSDGWAGLWPDPLLPLKTFDLEPDKTRPLWIEAAIPENTAGGDYKGRIRIFSNDSLIKELPWTVHVRNFTLPKVNSFGALYDYRSFGDMPQPGPEQFRTDISADSLRDMYFSFMAKHRVCSGEIDPVPGVIYKDGKVDIDFTGYDKAAAHYFNELKNPFAYLPVRIFYLFGWAFPPSAKFGEKPYPGDYPYEDADRSVLRPEYKKAYQAVLKTFWTHVKEKGWADRYVLYLSDEPHMAENSKADIVAQMKALCDMIHEVDPKIPVYVSTWWYRPEWEGYINIWGLGFNGEGDYGHLVTKEDMTHIIKSGARIWYTTDGNFCIETPYFALERLLPWFGYKFGAEAYEFWGVNWLTYNPYKYGWHSYIFESQAPGEESWKRYPNGDGYIIYPGKPIRVNGLISSIRLKQVREGAEDYEYLMLLGRLIEHASAGNPSLETARKTMEKALELVNIPCAMGRYSTSLLKSPDDLINTRDRIAESIEALSAAQP